MSKNSKTPTTTTTTTTTKEKKPRIKLEDRLAQLTAMAESDDTVAALVPAIESAISGVDEAKVAIKRAKRRLRKLIQAAFSGTEE